MRLDLPAYCLNCRLRPILLGVKRNFQAFAVFSGDLEKRGSRDSNKQAGNKKGGNYLRGFDIIPGNGGLALKWKMPAGKMHGYPFFAQGRKKFPRKKLAD